MLKKIKFTIFDKLTIHYYYLKRLIFPLTFNQQNKNNSRLINQFCQIANINSNIFNVSFDKSATNIIEKIFNHNVDNDTLIISTNTEHRNVQRVLQRYSHVYYIDINKILKSKEISHDVFQITSEQIFHDIELQASKFKKVFVYMIGTVNLSGDEIEQDFFIRLKLILLNIKVKNKFVIDAVQEMFLNRRKYEMFDYVIGTMHAILPNYNTGIVFYKHDDLLQKNIASSLSGFYKILVILLKNQNFIKSFNNILFNKYSPIINNTVIVDNNNTFVKINKKSPVLFSVGSDQGNVIFFNLKNKQFTYLNNVTKCNNIKKDFVFPIVLRAWWILISYGTNIDIYMNREHRYSVGKNAFKLFNSVFKIIKENNEER